MNDSNILVIVLFVIVSVLLVVDILVAVTIYKVVKHIKNVTEKADAAVSNFADVAKSATSMTVPLAITKLVREATTRFSGSDFKSKKKK